MSSLDDKLREISSHYHMDELSQDDAIAQIKQAYQEEGYVKTLKANGRTIVLNGKDPLGWIVYYPDEVMTGQEWYDRFHKEMDKEIAKDTSRQYDGLFYIAEEAAQRAAGIEK